ncbi:MAG: argininosuccinate synthase [Nitrososphaerota archaeon]|nr:argininosuccinate synthase [Nitrososphaerota archaeon]MDG6979055.1 argininosuccinate synthase [Nitrososphaerota archaeon]MDG7022126.1 argininosuccinate synthase [Nitrososphaerota archaeon]
MKQKIVLAYSGGLDTSVSIKWLQEKYGADVVTLTLNLGQKEDFKEIEERAYSTGAVKHFQMDAREEFAKGYVFPSIKANGMYQGRYPLATALGRPLIATKLVEVAESEGAHAVAHGCTGKGNDQVRMDVTVRSLNPSIRVIAPVREWNMSRDAEIVYARKHGINIKPKKSVFSTDQNLWGRSIESGPLEDPDTEPPPEAFEWVSAVDASPDSPGYLTIGFEAGLPVSLDGRKLDGVELIRRVNEFAGKHAYGIVDHIEDRLVGIKSREVYECPGALAIIEAHRDLEQLVLTRTELAFKAAVEREWSWLVYSGLWMEPLRFDLDAFIGETQKRADGEVRLKFHKGGMRIVGRSSPNSLYRLKLSTYSKESTFDQNSAVGFIELWGLQSRTAASAAASKTRGRTQREQHTERKQNQAVK